MRFAIIAAVGAANLAMAQYSNSTGPTLPERAGDFKLFGCATSSSGFSGFQNVATTDDMSIDMCAASCPTKYMGVIGKDCLCGDDIQAAMAMKVDNTRCNTPCPGNKAQACGSTGGMQRRHDASPDSPVSVYERVNNDNGSGSKTVTKTATSTQIQTITSCAPSVTNCPVGSKTTKISTHPTTVCEQPQAWVEWHKKKIVCYGDHCGPEIPCKAGEQKYRVICEGDHCRTEASNTDEYNKLVICKGTDCKYAECKGDECKQKKIVCFNGKCTYEKCIGSECEKKYVCQGDECKHEKCAGEDCYKKIICDANGQDCRTATPPTGPAAPPCKGDDCKYAHPPKPASDCEGDDCKYAHPPKPASDCEGDDCKYAHPPKPASGCEGDDCNIAANMIGAAAGLFFLL
ncbi:hypothetical protein EsHS_00002208 [Epichloe bromicola]